MPLIYTNLKWATDLGEATLVAATHDAGGLPYERKPRILGEMMGTLQLTSRP